MRMEKVSNVVIEKTLFMDLPEVESGLCKQTGKTVNLKSLATANYGSDVDIINEDGELATAYEAQKGINRQLQEELLSEKKFYSEHISKAKAEIERLREENEKYQNDAVERHVGVVTAFGRACRTIHDTTRNILNTLRNDTRKDVFLKITLSVLVEFSC